MKKCAVFYFPWLVKKKINLAGKNLEGGGSPSAREEAPTNLR